MTPHRRSPLFPPTWITEKPKTGFCLAVMFHNAGFPRTKNEFAVEFGRTAPHCLCQWTI